MSASEPEPEDFFALPAFKPDDALLDLRRRIRELRRLSERLESGVVVFELKGARVLTLQVADAQIRAQLAAAPARTPQWQERVLKNAAEVRGYFEEIKRRVAAWEDD